MIAGLLVSWFVTGFIAGIITLFASDDPALAWGVFFYPITVPLAVIAGVGWATQALLKPVGSWVGRKLRKPPEPTAEERLLAQIEQAKENLKLLELEKKLVELEETYMRRLNGEPEPEPKVREVSGQTLPDDTVYDFYTYGENVGLPRFR